MISNETRLNFHTDLELHTYKHHYIECPFTKLLYEVSILNFCFPKMEKHQKIVNILCNFHDGNDFACRHFAGERNTGGNMTRTWRNIDVI